MSDNEDINTQNHFVLDDNYSEDEHEINNFQNNIDQNQNITSNNSEDEIDFRQYQNNINDAWVMAPEKINLEIECMPLIYYPEYDLLPDLDYSNKIILPKHILDKLSKYEGINYPLMFTINNNDLLFTPYDFKENIECAFIPSQIFDNFRLNLSGSINLTLINKKITLGTKIKLKPHTSNFLEIYDHKHFLESILTKNFTTLTKGQIISVKYFDSIINIDVLECHPQDTILIVDTDLEVDFDKPYDYKEPQPIKKNEANTSNINYTKSSAKPKLNFNQNYNSDQTQSNENKDQYTNDKRFPGKGRRLGDK